MGQSTISIRLDDTIKKQFDSLCAEFGMSASTAFNIYARTVVRQRRIPFEITAENDPFYKLLEEENKRLKGKMSIMPEVRAANLPQNVPLPYNR